MIHPIPEQKTNYYLSLSACYLYLKACHQLFLLPETAIELEMQNWFERKLCPIFVNPRRTKTVQKMKKSTCCSQMFSAAPLFFPSAVSNFERYKMTMLIFSYEKLNFAQKIYEIEAFDLSICSISVCQTCLGTDLAEKVLRLAQI